MISEGDNTRIYSVQEISRSCLSKRPFPTFLKLEWGVPVDYLCMWTIHGDLQYLRVFLVYPNIFYGISRSNDCSLLPLASW